MIDLLLERGIPAILTPPAMWVVWRLAQAKERQEDYRSLMDASRRAKERGNYAEAERLFAAAQRLSR
jgi:hypothetical protein